MRHEELFCHHLIFKLYHFVFPFSFKPFGHKIGSAAFTEEIYLFYPFYLESQEKKLFRCFATTFGPSVIQIRMHIALVYIQTICLHIFTF